MNKPRFKVSLIVRENAPSVYGVFDTHDRSQGRFNGKLVAEYPTEYHADQYARALNLHKPLNEEDQTMRLDVVHWASPGAAKKVVR